MSSSVSQLWVSAGEMSGDMHAANLVRAIQAKAPHIRFAGVGGPDLRKTGFEDVFKVEDLSVMGITEVLSHLPRILGMLKRIRQELAARRPDAVILVDAPSFNFRIAKYAKELGIPVYYYISPKIWAWRTGRVKFIRRYVDKVISILPFEVDFYRQHDMEIDYVGNPLVDMVDWNEIDALAPIPQRIGLLPGSRKKEITSLMPQFAIAAEHMRKELPELEFHCVRAPGVSEDNLRELWGKRRSADNPCTGQPLQIYARMHHAAGSIRHCDAGVRIAGYSHAGSLQSFSAVVRHRQTACKSKICQSAQSYYAARGFS